MFLDAQYNKHNKHKTNIMNIMHMQFVVQLLTEETLLVARIASRK